MRKIPNAALQVGSAMKERLPRRVREWWRRGFGWRGPGSPLWRSRNVYEHAYEALARTHVGDDAVGGGDFDLIGRIERDLLLMEGLKPTDTLIDFGCGNGRLAIHAIPA